LRQFRSGAGSARDLGGNRQNVQRILNDLHHEGLVEFEANPHHRRAKLVVLTEKGQRAFDSAMELQAPWINDMAAGFSAKDLRTMHRLIAALRDKLESKEK
jgi:DNA-binding MarR family transcriptional regulator